MIRPRLGGSRFEANQKQGEKSWSVSNKVFGLRRFANADGLTVAKLFSALPGMTFTIFQAIAPTANRTTGCGLNDRATLSPTNPQ